MKGFSCASFILSSAYTVSYHDCLIAFPIASYRCPGRLFCCASWKAAAADGKHASPKVAF